MSPALSDTGADAVPLADVSPFTLTYFSLLERDFALRRTSERLVMNATLAVLAHGLSVGFMVCRCLCMVSSRSGVVRLGPCMVLSLPVCGGSGMVVACPSVVTCRCGMIGDSGSVVGCGLYVVSIGTVYKFRHLCMITHGGLVVTLRTGVVLVSLLVVGYGHGMDLRQRRPGGCSRSTVAVSAATRLASWLTRCCSRVHALLLAPAPCFLD